ncbi:hypothetical protein HAX54_027549 [Datura stramonium]|uniref:Uncharacterized protein n=1 Tax=Datura stramonium TaxID=4076 RepID=A0ABS8V4R7_DATST|nr:hypothetical protein [Datura stramonium]
MRAVDVACVMQTHLFADYPTGKTLTRMPERLPPSPKEKTKSKEKGKDTSILANAEESLCFYVESHLFADHPTGKTLTRMPERLPPPPKAKAKAKKKARTLLSLLMWRKVDMKVMNGKAPLPRMYMSFLEEAMATAHVTRGPINYLLGSLEEDEERELEDDATTTIIFKLKLFNFIDVHCLSHWAQLTLKRVALAPA